jgi:ATP-binding cassette subfamily F protein 3
MLNLNGITVRLGGHTILDRASASLPPGSKVGLVGSNGAGKSTLMRVIAGQMEPDEGAVEIPRKARVGYLTQEVPSGEQTPLVTVLSADGERSRLLARAEQSNDALVLAETHERLNAIEAHAAPARAAKILVGLGFDDEAQSRPLDSFSGGWRMRVALAALLFAEPDLLLLDEPSNHLDLEATLWLERHLAAFRGTMLIVSHERDLLNTVADHVLHLEQGHTAMYHGGYDAFERQRTERLAQSAAAREKQLAQRARLQAFVDRWQAKSHTAKQAQSRMKALARMEPVAAALEDSSLAFEFPSPDGMKPPLLALEDVAVGYTPDHPVLRRVNLRIDPDDRIALLGRNGNGKTTLARVLASQLQPMQGNVAAARKLRVGYFTQYQVEELDSADTPLQHMARLMPDAPPKTVRAHLGRFGFSGEKATLEVGRMSGGERARLALALVTRDAPHLLILDEPTNHLDVDAREALVQALSEYGGAVVIVSHDRHMLELIADRLILVGDGTAREFDGNLGDYTAHILGQSAVGTHRSGGADRSTNGKGRKRSADSKSRERELRTLIRSAAAEIVRFDAELQQFDRILTAPASASQPAQRPVSDLLRQRAEVAALLNEAERRWIEASERLDALKSQ